MMNKLQKLSRKTVLLTVGKALTLCGVALTFAACYGVNRPEPVPDYWAQKNAEETLLGVDKGRNSSHSSEQAERVNCETRAESPAEQESRNERSVPLPDE